MVLGDSKYRNRRLTSLCHSEVRYMSRLLVLCEVPTKAMGQSFHTPLNVPPKSGGGGAGSLGLMLSLAQKLTTGFVPEALSAGLGVPQSSDAIASTDTGSGQSSLAADYAQKPKCAYRSTPEANFRTAQPPPANAPSTLYL